MKISQTKPKPQIEEQDEDVEERVEDQGEDKTEPGGIIDKESALGARGAIAIHDCDRTDTRLKEDLSRSSSQDQFKKHSSGWMG